ncbi:hypothetical protein FNJ88_07935 [Chryseobacterium sp. SNU WT5]|uniref:DUF5689 domain-containing protein n=1 Tax=Chryseobacterium sp. SNU WT5 TaxID=2594269 RepID=UPI00117D8891|nr:DUF5689 domain-containing protein [Chryseobacterium sp. SNU WT5]QDP85493.1 hypothetical protein FNJ88_07935 [Chryseobacterium sp. SNU WT5]
MNFKKYFKTAFVIALAVITVSSCVDKDEWETPPINCNNKFAAPTISLANFVAMAPSNGYILISNDVIFDGYIISSDENGNFYKTISFQDKPENPTVGLQMEVDRASNYADFPVGTHIRINANGLRLGTDRGTVKLGSVDPNFDIGRIPGVLFSKYISAVCNGSGMEVVPIKPKELSSLSDAMKVDNLNTLVSVPNVQFTSDNFSPATKAYIDYVGGAGVDTSRSIEDVTGSSSIIRSSGFASYGSALLPNGSGSITFIVSKYNSDYQLLIRGLNDVKLDKPRLVLNVETFTSYAQSLDNFLPKYYNTSLLGTKKWYVQTYNSNKYIQISGNNGGLVKTHFAIPVNLTTKTKLAFKTNAGYYNGDVLKVYWSTNYDPANPTAATLNDITSQFDISKGKVPGAAGSNYESSFRSSGIGSLGGSGNGYIVFEYNANTPGATTVMQLDDISIF